MAALTKNAWLGIGSTDFQQSLRAKYAELIGRRWRREDVAFRKTRNHVPPEQIWAAVCRHTGARPADLKRRRPNDYIRPLLAVLLTTDGGLSQREAARLMGLGTGAAVCLQLKKARGSDAEFRRRIDRIRREFNI